MSASPAAFPRARSACASCAGWLVPPPGTPDAIACGSHALHCAATTLADADTRNAASTSPTPPVACAAVHRCVLSGSNNSPPRSRSARKPGAGSLRTSSAANPRPPAGLRAPSVFCDQRLQHLFVQAQIDHQLLQLRVLIPQLLRFLRLAHVHPAVLRLPGVDRVLRHSHFPRHVFGFAPCLQLFQRPDHLRLRVLAPRHASFPFPSTKSYSVVFGKRGSGQWNAVALHH